MSFQNGLYSLNCHIVEKFRLGVIMMGLDKKGTVCIIDAKNMSK